MTLNLDADIGEQMELLDIWRWSALQAAIAMNVATAKYFAFVWEADRLAEFVRLGLISRATAADYLQSAAVYSQLSAEYGRDAIQGIISAAFQEVAA